MKKNEIGSIEESLQIVGEATIAAFWINITSITTMRANRYGPFDSIIGARLWAKEHHIIL